MRSATPLAKSKIVNPIIAYHKVCRAIVTLSLLPPLVIKTIAAQIITIVEIVAPIPKSQVAIVPISVGMSLPPLPNGLGTVIPCPEATLVIILRKIIKSKKVFIVYIITGSEGKAKVKLFTFILPSKPVKSSEAKI